MSHDKIIQAVRIYLDTVETENTALGIFTSGGTSEIRLSEEPLSGVALPWTSGLIALNGINDRSESGDLSLGGSPANYDGSEIELINTNQYLLNLAAVGVYLPGLKCEIWEFRGTENDNDSTSASVVATYIVEDISGDEERLTIPLKNGTYKRNAQMLKAINTVDYPNASDDLIGKLIPATFGSFVPDDVNNIRNLARFTGFKNAIDYTKYSHAYFTDAETHSDWFIFPVVDGVLSSGGLWLKLKFAVQDMASLPGGPVLNPDNMYCEIISGSGIGQVKKVSQIEITADYAKVYVTFDEVFETDLSISAATRSWVRFFDCDRRLMADFLKCKDFLKSSGVSTSVPELYSYSNGFKRIADYAYDSIVDSNKNKLRIIPSYTTEDISKINSFAIIPIDNLSLESAADLTNWQAGARTGYADYDKKENGIYIKPSIGHDYDFVLENYAGLVNPTNAYDKNSTTKADFTFNSVFAVLTGSSWDVKYYKVLKFTPPELPKNIIDNDNVKIYLGIKAITSAVDLGYSEGARKIAYDPIDDTKSSFHIICQRLGGVGYLGDLWSGDDDIFMLEKNIDEVSDFSINDMPDFYFSDLPSNYNQYFYKQSEAPYSELNGYKLFELDYTLNSYKTISHIGLFFGREFDGINVSELDVTDKLELYELAIIVEINGANVSENVFTPFSGRIFNDTWGARKTAANLITLPNDMLEHCKRLQNWSETGETGIDWGKEYATSALIKTGDVEGSYDRITTLTDQTPAFQLEDDSEGYTDSLAQRLSEAFDLCPYIDKDGYECVEDMELHDPAETITEADLADDPGQLQEARSEDVYCEPVVNYQYNAGSGEYDKSLRVFNIQGYADGGAWTASSSGFANQTDAETVLDIYAALWLKFRTVEKCPSNFSDVRFFVTYADALSYIIRKGNRMGRARISCSVDYEKGYDYNVYKHVQLNLAQVTNGNDVECMIEKLRISKRDNRVDLTLVLLEPVIL